MFHAYWWWNVCFMYWSLKMYQLQASELLNKKGNGWFKNQRMRDDSVIRMFLFQAEKPGHEFESLAPMQIAWHTCI